MAQEKPRTSRARAKADAKPEAAAETKAKTTKTTAAPQPAVRRTRRKAAPAVAPTPDAIATVAYLMWERGEPGDATEHWLRAEAELRAAA